MTQEELLQLKTLLQKAQEMLPKAEDFQVWEQPNGTLALYGSRTTVYTGGFEEWVMTTDGIEESGKSLF